MRCLLDTHFLLWIVGGSKRLRAFPWLDDYRPFGVSPVSFLEVAFLGEVGRITVRPSELCAAVGEDPRFAVDDAPLGTLIERALELGWTRDPFDRLLAAHSSARRVPLCSLDRTLHAHHALVVRELRA